MHFPGRSKNSIKNRYVVLLRRSQMRGAAIFSIDQQDAPGPRPPTHDQEHTSETHYTLDDESVINSDGIYNGLSSTSVGFEASTHYSLFSHCYSWDASDTPTSWTQTPHNNPSISPNVSNFCIPQTTSPSALSSAISAATFVPFWTGLQDPMSSHSVGPSLFFDPDNSDRYLDPWLGCFDFSQSPSLPSPSEAEFHTMASVIAPKFSPLEYCDIPGSGSGSGSGSPNAVKVFLRFKRPDEQTMTNSM